MEVPLRGAFCETSQFFFFKISDSPIAFAPPLLPNVCHCLLWGAYRALCEKLAVLHHREFGKFRRLKGCH